MSKFEVGDGIRAGASNAPVLVVREVLGKCDYLHDCAGTFHWHREDNGESSTYAEHADDFEKVPA